MKKIMLFLSVVVFIVSLLPQLTTSMSFPDIPPVNPQGDDIIPPPPPSPPPPPPPPGP